MLNNKNNNTGVIWGVSLAVFLTNLSQLPYFSDNGITQYLNIPIWIGLLIFICFTKNRFFISKNSIKIIINFGLVILFALIFQMIGQKTYLGSSIVICMAMSVFMFIIGDIVGIWVNEKSLKKILISYVVSAMLVSIEIFVQFFSNGLGLDSRVYLFDSKNSFAQIVFSALVILFFLNDNKNKLYRIFRIGTILFFSFSIMILRSRATILGLILCIVIMAIMKTKNKRNKRMIWIAIITSALILIFSSDLRDVIFNNILFAGRDLTNVDDLTSGRLSIISSFPELIKGQWLTGIGNIYFECFPLSVILNLGILAGSLVILFAYSPLIYSLKYKYASIYHEMFFFIVIGFVINSMFEGLAPIGPGAKCYILWLLFGMFSKIRLEKRLFTREI